MSGRGYTGEIAGVRFEDGTPTGPASDPQARAIIAYAARKGLRVDGDRLVIPDPSADDRPDARTATRQTAGTRLRDAAVDPRARDFLPPVNAGQADPHGPAVVSPEVHGSQGVRPVTPGVVPDAPTTQEGKAQAHTAEVADPVERPKDTASKASWVAWAITQGADPDEAAAATKAELIEAHGGEA